MKKTNVILLTIVLFIIVGGISFYAGMKYGKSTGVNNQFSFSKKGPEGGLPSMNGNGSQKGLRNGDGFTAGEIISKDDESITVKLRDGGSKIIFLTDNVSVTKSTEGSLEDLKEGEQINVSGSSNEDGSINAQSIQIRPFAEISQ
jgi:hypothetical protein